ncbi:mechanosensitive ion channel family protein [Eubacteriales bacterium OttesenSCG-928-N13]|nr:mechanosensitive ion channel family protein [Eubacteriales bacterium OttesenSCG-928-N13]
MDVQGFLDFKIGAFSVEMLLRSLVIVVIALIAVRLIMMLVRRALKKLPIDKALDNFISSGIRFALWFVVALLVCDALGLPTSSLLALFGVVGLAISLSIQGWLGNLASGLLILFTKPFTINDYIEAGSGISGTVQQIALIHTTLSTPDNKLVFVPNGQLTASQVTNYTRMPTRRVEVSVLAPHNAPIEQVKEILLTAAKNQPDVLLDPAPFAALSGRTEGASNYVLRVWCAGSEYWNVFYQLTEQIYLAFAEAHLDPPTNRLDVHIQQ